MGSELRMMWVLGVLLLTSNLLGVVLAASQVPCYYIFGDSLVDNGNNNQIASLAKANYRPYGIDFPSGPTGRFNNGRTTTDVVGQLLGFDYYIPPYANARGREILYGVNYASAAAGIREETGQQLGGRLSMRRQVENHRLTVQQVVSILGNHSAASHLSRCIYMVVMGSNDYLNNYFMPLFYTSGRQYTPEQFATLLIQQFSQQLRNLYNEGARKVALVGVGQVGCSPSELAQYSPNGSTCISRINNAIQLFNKKLKSLVDNFNHNLPGAKFIYVNAYGIFGDILGNARSHGFTVTNRGCCGVGRNNGQVTCLPNQTPCQNRNQHIFWDAYHPTEAFNVIFARRAYSAQSSSDAYPIDIRRLARL